MGGTLPEILDYSAGLKIILKKQIRYLIYKKIVYISMPPKRKVESEVFLVCQEGEYHEMPLSFFQQDLYIDSIYLFLDLTDILLFTFFLFMYSI